MQFTRKHFDPATAPAAIVEPDGQVTCRLGDGPGGMYVYSPQIILAVNLALSTNRPLIISGEPGSGKTTLAINAARILERWFFKETVTSRTRAEDLLWRFDTLRRLNDAQSRNRAALLPRQHYVEPGTLWWAFDPTSAAARGRQSAVDAAEYAKNPGLAGRDDRAVVLLDEIDKADPDLPNDLLEPFDVGSFTVRDTNDPIERTRDVLLMLTTNGERELPPAFLRRCVALKLPDPTDDWFVKIAERRLHETEQASPLLRDVAAEVMAWRQRTRKAGVRAPGTAEYLDAVLACRELGITPASTAWRDVALAVLWKNDKEPPPAPTP